MMREGMPPASGWPAMSLAAAQAALTEPGSPFEIATETIRGVPTRVWRNAPPSLVALLELARAHDDRTFIVLDDERVSYAAHRRAVAALAAELARAGVAKGDRVAIAMRNLPEFPAALFAITALGAIAVPLNAWWTGAELAFALGDSGARALIADDERHRRLADHYGGLPVLTAVYVARAKSPTAGGAVALEDVIGPPARWHELPDAPLPATPIAPDDPATIFYTSGTTGTPKGALGTHRNLMTNIVTSAYAGARMWLRRGDAPPAAEPKVMLMVIPLFHVTACSAALMGAVASGSTIVLMRRWDAPQAFALIERERVQVTGGVPTIAWQLLEHPERGRYDLSSLESIAYGGAPSAPELARAIAAEFGALPGNGWGMTETMATVTSIAAEDYLARPASAGPPAPVADLKVTDAAGDALAPGTVGELWARGPMTVIGYWNRPEASAEAFVDGWVRTGDLATLDEEGFLTVVDRVKDMVIRGGENIYAIEVENALYAHPAVTDCALIGLPHRALGEEPAAVVHLAPGTGADESELRGWVAARLAAFKVPVAIAFLPDPLPRNANGKIMKRELKDLFADRVTA